MSAAVLNRMLEDCQIGGQPHYRQVVDVVLEPAAGQQVPCCEAVGWLSSCYLLRNFNRLLPRQKSGEVIVKQIADAFYRHVRRRTCGDDFCVVGIPALTRKSGGYPVTPGFFDRG